MIFDKCMYLLSLYKKKNGHLILFNEEKATLFRYIFLSAQCKIYHFKFSSSTDKLQASYVELQKLGRSPKSKSILNESGGLFGIFLHL